MQNTIDAHTARTLHNQDGASGSSGGNDGDSGGDQATSVGKEQRALHFTRYKSFDTIEESDMHPELKKEEDETKRDGGKEMIRWVIPFLLLSPCYLNIFLRIRLCTFS